MPIEDVDTARLVQALGYPFRLLPDGTQDFRPLGEKAAALAYQLTRRPPFHRLNDLATIDIFTAFLYLNDKFWTLAPDRFFEGLDAIGRWPKDELWRRRIEETGIWVESNTDATDFRPEDLLP